jgi:hypothetical protein
MFDLRACAVSRAGVQDGVIRKPGGCLWGEAVALGTRCEWWRDRCRYTVS